MQKVQELKDEYNYWIDRNKKAEEYFKTHTVQECIKHLKLFNEITQKLSTTALKIEILTGKNMTTDEKLNGFK